MCCLAGKVFSELSDGPPHPPENAPDLGGLRVPDQVAQLHAAGRLLAPNRSSFRLDTSRESERLGPRYFEIDLSGELRVGDVPPSHARAINLQSPNKAQYLLSDRRISVMA